MQSIEVEGKKYSFCWGTLAFLNTCDALGYTLEELHEKIALNDHKSWFTLAYQALVNHENTTNNGVNVFNGQIDGFNYAQFLNWLDNAPQEIGDQISKSYTDSMYMGKTMEARYIEIIEKMNIELDEVKSESEGRPSVKKKERTLGEIIIKAYAMGLKPIEVNRLTLYEFAMMEMGDFYRKSEELDRLRTLQSTIMTFGGMGSTKLISPKDVMVIPILDNEEAILPIKSREQALRMVELYIKGLEWQN